MARKIGAMVAELSLDGKKYTKGTREAIQQTKNLNKSLNETGKVIANVVKAALALGVAFGTYKLGREMTNLIKTSTLLAARYETLGVVIEQLGKNALYSKEQVHAASKAIEQSGIEMNAARQMTARLIQAEVDLTQAHKLARIAQDAAVIGNINSTEAFERMIHGMVTGQVRVLRMIGIQVLFETGYKKMAAQLGKTVEELSAFEKQTSRTNQIIEYGPIIQGTYEAAMGTAGKQLLSFTRYIENLKTILGEAFLPVFKKIIAGAKDLIEYLREWVEVNKELIRREALQAWEGIAMVFGYLGEIVRENKTELTWLLGWTGDFIKLLAHMQKIGMMISPIGLIKRLMNAYRQMKDYMFDEPSGGERLKLRIQAQVPRGYGGPDMWTRTPGYLKGMVDSWATGGASGADVPYPKDTRELATGSPWVGEAKETFNIMKTLAEETAKDMHQSFSDFFFNMMTGDFKNLGDVLKGFLQSIMRTTSSILSKVILGAIFSGTPYGKLFVGAEGGIINEPILGMGASGNKYLFGESGPEMVSPLGGGGGGNYNITINAVDAASFDALVRRNPRSILGVVTEDMEYGGSMRSAMKGAR